MLNRHQGDIFLQYQKGELSREETTDKIICHALKSKRWLFKQDDDDDDDVQGTSGGEDIQGEESGNEEFFDSSEIWSPENRERERDLIRKNMQTDKC